MAITKVVVCDVIQIDEFARINYRVTTRVIDEDGSVIGERHHRTAIIPGSPPQDHPQMVQAIIDLLHTPEVIATYQAHLDSLPNPP